MRYGRKHCPLHFLNVQTGWAWCISVHVKWIQNCKHLRGSGEEGCRDHDLIQLSCIVTDVLLPTDRQRVPGLLASGLSPFCWELLILRVLFLVCDSWLCAVSRCPSILLPPHDLILIFLSQSQKRYDCWLDTDLRNNEDAHRNDWVVHYSRRTEKKRVLVSTETVFCECFQLYLHPAHPIWCPSQGVGGAISSVSCNRSSCQIHFCSLQLTINHTLLSC